VACITGQEKPERPTGHPPIEALLEADTGVTLRDAKTASVTPHHGPTSTFNNFRPEVLPERRIDYVFVSESVRVHRHGHLSARWNGQFPSDHLPVSVEVTVPEERSD
jgi:endonuclease/exonuclease/phosphatase family metal-dependent hydrolase